MFNMMLQIQIRVSVSQINRRLIQLSYLCDQGRYSCLCKKHRVINSGKELSTTFKFDRFVSTERTHIMLLL